LLARLYVSSKQLDKALPNYQTAVAKDPKNVESWMMIGLIYDQQKNYPAARDAYEKLLAVNPDFGSALNNLACLSADHFNQLDRAYELAQHAREVMPAEAHVADSLGWILHRQKQYSRALGLLRESAFKLPESAAIQFHLGMAASATGEDETARRSLQRALDLDKALPEADEARQALAVLAIDPATAGANERATLEKILAAQPDDPAVLTRLAGCYERAGQADSALRTAEAAVKANPNNVKALILLTKLNITKDPAKALTLGRSARKLAPDDPDVAYALGRLALQAGDDRWAAGLLKEAAVRKIDEPDVLYDLAEASYRVGQIGEAAESAKNALELGGKFSRKETAQRFVELAALANDPAAAAAASARIEQILRNEPDYLPALFPRGLGLEQNAKAAEARALYEKILNRYPDFSPARKRLTALTPKKSGEKK
ncbi:MAG TPA: tetratricopeptide repeat protein, partial [Candidatus Didemnitutus sp.]|nr:tetratricopeptide repeat protein [Candidatus Didemnitutus sp.]